MAYNYYAFISYSRKDKAAARYLQNKLENYRYPSLLVDSEHKPENPKYIRKIFRDTSDLDVTQNDFTEAIDRHIAESRYLVVLCSPNSCRSVWVEREIARFFETHGRDPQRVFPIILEGDVPDCLPEVLRTPEFTNRNIPTMIPDDASSQKEGWAHGFLQLAGCLLNVPFAKISDRFQKAKQATLRRIVFGTLAALAVTVGLTVWALIAEHKARVAERKAVAAERTARHEAEVAQGALKFVNDAFDAADATKSGSMDMTLLEFARTSAARLDKLPVPEVKLELAKIILPLLGKMGDPKAALERMLPLLPEAERIYPPDSLNRGNFYFKLARLFGNNARYDEAVEYYLKSLTITRQKFGEDHPNVAITLNNIGNVCKYKGEYDRAIEYYRQALEIKRKKLGADHPSTAYTLHNIGDVCKSKGEYGKAIEYYRQALEIKRKKLGADHPVITSTENGLGYLLVMTGKETEGLKLLDHALTVGTKKLGPDHPDTATSYHFSGLARLELAGRNKSVDALTSAEEYLRKALAIRMKKLGPDHPDTRETLRALEKLEQLRSGGK